MIITLCFLNQLAVMKTVSKHQESNKWRW